jgi:hypothetical protein
VQRAARQAAGALTISKLTNVWNEETAMPGAMEPTQDVQPQMQSSGRLGA